MEEKNRLVELNQKESNISATALETALIAGDLSRLTTEQRISYYHKVCELVGLNPLTRPFEYIILNSKLVLYAKKEATDQLRQIREVSIQISSREVIGDVYVVTAKAKLLKNNREDESTGAVAIGKATGDTLANLYMKAETKAKRRATLSICGLGMLDETEVETIANRVTVDAAPQTKVPHMDRPKPNRLVAKSEPDGPERVLTKESRYIVPFGKFKGRYMEEIPNADLEDYCDWLLTYAAKKGQARGDMSETAQEFLHLAEKRIFGDEQ